jgi:Ala-tRNA(Pro) deacylase
MAISQKLAKYLRTEKVPYYVFYHPQRFTALETAEVEHVPARQVAKVVMLKSDGRDIMAVVPANRHVGLLKAVKELGTQDIRLETEDEFKPIFSECEPGAMPPFGILYDVPCYVDKRLAEEPFIFFNAGDHNEGIQMDTTAYLRIAEARIADLAI